MHLRIFPPPSHELEEVDGSEQLREVTQLELVEVEMTNEPVLTFFHIQVSNAAGGVWTVMKRYLEIVEFFEALRPLTGFVSLPWDDGESEEDVASNEDYHMMIQDQLDALLCQRGAMSEQLFLDFFHISAEYKQRGRRLSLGAQRPGLFARAEQLVAAVHAELRKRYQQERRVLEQLSPSKDHTKSSTWRRQELYHSDDFCARMRATSLQHLKRHPEWLTGRGQLSDAELRDIIAMQHYVDLELQDLQLPQEKRCYGDSFSGESMSRQMLLDATRSIYEIDGRSFSFPELYENHGRPEGEKTVLQNCFLESLITAVQGSLGRAVAPPPLLTQAITSTMSQAGLANLDLACGGPHIAVCGGDNKVHFRLQARADGAWDVMLSTHKVGFDHFIPCSSTEGAPLKTEPLTCSATSSILKRCTVRFTLRFTVPISDGTVEADVLSIHKKVSVVDGWGRSLLHEADCAASCFAFLSASGRRLSCARGLVSRFWARKG